MCSLCADFLAVCFWLGISVSGLETALENVGEIDFKLGSVPAW